MEDDSQYSGVRAKQKGFVIDMSRPRTRGSQPWIVKGALALCLYDIGYLFQSAQDAVAKLASGSVWNARLANPLRFISPDECYPKTSVKRWNRTEGVKVDILDSIDRLNLAMADAYVNYLPVIDVRADIETSDVFSSLDYNLGALKVELLPKQGRRIDDGSRWFDQAARIMNVGTGYFREVALRFDGNVSYYINDVVASGNFGDDGRVLGVASSQKSGGASK